MSLAPQLQDRLSLPLVAAPMFLLSGPELVIACCKAGIVGTFPALNRRSSDEFEQWLIEITEALAQYERETGVRPAPFGVNLIVHASNPRLQADLDLCVRYRVPLVITSLGAASELVGQVHGYGGIVFHDVINQRHARKAAAAGVDGLIAVCAGAGGHAGNLNPFALVAEIRNFFDKTLLLAGGLSSGRDIAAARMLGADLAYMGTRFINTRECRAQPEYQQMVIDSNASEVVYTPKISGIHANFLSRSLAEHGVELDMLGAHAGMNTAELDTEGQGVKPWRDIWSAGHGVGAIDDCPSVESLCQQLQQQYRDAITGLQL